MKKFLVAVAFGLMAIAAQAEASFDQIEGLIQQKNYAAAAAGLEGIIQNHPKSAKAFYAMAQAQAGLGNLEKAQKALNIATGLNPTLDFAPSSSVQSLRDAITPQTAKIEAVEESHAFRNFVLFVMFAGFAAAMYFLYSVYARKQEEEAKEAAEQLAEAHARAEAKVKRMQAEREAEEARQKAHDEAVARMQAHPNYGHERFDPENPDKLKTIKRMKEEKAAQVAAMKAEMEAIELRNARARAERAEMDARLARSNASSGPAHTTVVNNSSNDMLTGIMIGNMISNSGHHHDTERTVVRETVREVPAPSRDSSWDDAPAKSSSRSSSWDDDSSSSSKSSSSWSSSSSSDSSSSWSSSSDSSSSSSSSWD